MPLDSAAEGFDMPAMPCRVPQASLPRLLLQQPLVNPGLPGSLLQAAQQLNARAHCRRMLCFCQCSLLLWAATTSEHAGHPLPHPSKPACHCGFRCLLLGWLLRGSLSCCQGRCSVASGLMLVCRPGAPFLCLHNTHEVA